MAACLFLFGMFYFIVGNFSHMIKEVESSVGLTVFFDEGASQKQMDSIGEAIKSREEVDHIEFVSAEQAWKEFAAENFKDNPDLVDSFAGDNPLADSASYQVYVKDISKQDELASYIREIAGVRLVKQSADAAKQKNDKRNHRSNQSNHHAFHDKRRTNKKSERSHKTHNSNLGTAYRNSRRNRRLNQEN